MQSEIDALKEELKKQGKVGNLLLVLLFQLNNLLANGGGKTIFFPPTPIPYTCTYIVNSLYSLCNYTYEHVFSDIVLYIDAQILLYVLSGVHKQYPFPFFSLCAPGAVLSDF